jgi:hypothetical protein
VKITNCAIAVSATAALIAGCGAATSASKPPNPNTLKKVECSALHFSDEFLKKYPEAPGACVDAREYQGKRYAKFKARVYLNSEDRTTVTLLGKDGKDLTTFSFRPGPNATIRMNGKDTKVSNYRPGEVISFWVSEDRMAASALPASSEESWAVLPPLPQQ